MSQPIRVLIVEDCVADAEIVLRELRRAGFEPDWRRVDTEEDYLEGLKSGLDVVLSDYRMPQFDGARALELLKQRGLDVPFIIISGTIGEEVAVSVMKQGASDYLLKDRLARLGPAVSQALDQNRLRTQRRQAEEAVRESERRYRQLIDGLPVAVYTTDEAGYLWLFNEAAVALWGRTPNLGTDRWCGALRLYTANGAELRHDECPMAVALRENRPIRGAEIVAERPDGSRLAFLTYPRPLHDSAGILTGGMNVLVDITERRHLEDKFRQSHKMEAIGQLASGVAHDFNNLLMVIQGNASLLLMGEPTEAKVKNHSQQIVRATERAAGLTRQLLLFSRKQVMQPANLDLNEVVGNVIKMLQRILGEDISLISDYRPNLPLIHADAGMIEQLLMNLVVNARDAMAGGGRLVIATDAKTVDAAQAQENPEATQGPCVCLTVNDSGCGIPPEVLPHIFEPFFTTKEAGKGTGLGLATVYGIVKQHCGWIEVASEKGQGATFSIYLPAVTGPRAALIAEAKATKPPGGTETILVVEDDRSLRMLVGNLLQRCGYTVLQAVSGVDALEVWAEHKEKIHLLLTDLVMPDGMTGHELAKILLAERPHLKVIYTSGYSAEMAVGAGPELVDGVNFLPKPYPSQQLALTVRHCLDSR